MAKTRKSMIPPAMSTSSRDMELLAAFAQAALTNPSLMEGTLTPREAAHRALTIARELLQALRKGSLPEIEEPSPEYLEGWERSLRAARDRYERSVAVTVPLQPGPMSLCLSSSTVSDQEHSESVRSVTRVDRHPGRYHQVSSRALNKTKPPTP